MKIFLHITIKLNIVSICFVCATVSKKGVINIFKKLLNYCDPCKLFSLSLSLSLSLRNNSGVSITDIKKKKKKKKKNYQKERVEMVPRFEHCTSCRLRVVKQVQRLIYIHTHTHIHSYRFVLSYSFFCFYHGGKSAACVCSLI